MKDQSPILEEETKKDKWDRGRTLFLESLYKPDPQLRGCAHNQKCHDELMEIRDVVIDLVKAIPNPHKKAGEKNEQQVKSFNGISVTLLGGALGQHYMKDWTEDQVKEYKEYISINT